MEKGSEPNLQSIRIALQREFVERCRRNRAYSLRAFAKYLEIDQSFLSKLLNGHRQVTMEFAQSVSPKLGIKPQQLREILSTEQNSNAHKNNSAFLNLSDDEFEFISEWYHFAILELFKIKHIDPDPHKIAFRLNLHVEQVREAIDRLQRLGFIKKSESEIKILAPKLTWSQASQTTAARTKLQRSLIEKSLEAIDQTPFEWRDHSSVTIAINKNKLPKFKEKLVAIRRELASLFQSENETELDEVYQLTVSFFPLTQFKEK